MGNHPPAAPLPRLRSIVFDCAQPSALDHFWPAALGYCVRPYDQKEIDCLHAAGLTPETDPSVVIDPPATGPTVWCNRVPEQKSSKNRVHIDLNLDRFEDVDRLVDLGARVLRSWDEVPGERGFIMADPEGNEFCAFPPEDDRGDPRNEGRDEASDDR